MLNEQGKIANFVAVKQDVTERKEAQARLEQNNRDLLALSKAEHEQRQLAETLAEANLALTRSLDLETVLETLLDCVERLVPYDSANVMLLEAESRLAVRSARGYERWSNAEQVRAILDRSMFRPIPLSTSCDDSPEQIGARDTCVQPGWEYSARR